MNTKRLLTYLILPFTLAVNSAPSMAVVFSGTIVNYDLNPDVVRNPARLICLKVLTSPTTTQWGCLYANNRLASRIESASLEAAIFKKTITMSGSSFDVDGALVIREVAILP